MADEVDFPELRYGLPSSPSWRIDREGERPSLEMLKETAEFISYYRTLPAPTVAKVRKGTHLKLACNYVLISNVGQNVGSKTIGDTEDVIFRSLDKGTSSQSNHPPSRPEQETMNTLRALEELETIQKGKMGQDSPTFPLLSPRELRQVHEKLLKHDDGREPGKFRSVLVFAEMPGPLKDPNGTYELHSVELCLRGIAASMELPVKLHDTIDQVIDALAQKLNCEKDEHVILLRVAQETLYAGSDDMNEVLAHLLPTCINELFASTDVGSIISQPDRIKVEAVLAKLSDHYGIGRGGPLTSEDSDDIYRRVVAELPPTFHMYPLKTPGMIEDALQQLYEKQMRWFEVFNAKYTDEALKDCQTLQDALWLLARIAAYSLFQFVCLHPFCDGNGRMCRLIASAIMSAIVPFPTGLACEQVPGVMTHKVYVDAIVDCRQRGNQEPVELATLIVEGAYYCSRIMKESLRDHLNLGRMTCMAEDSEGKQRDEVAAGYKALDHSRRPGDHQTDAEIEVVFDKVKEAIGLERGIVEVEFDDKYFVQVDILF